MDVKPTLMTKEKTTAIKGGLAFLILAHHILEFMDSSEAVYPIHMGYLFVAAFFWISGYGVRKSLRQKKNYLKGFLTKSLSKLYLPFLAVSGIYIGVRYCFGITYSLETIFVSLFGIKTIASFSWFVFEIIALYVLFYLAFAISETYGDWIVLFGSILFVLIANGRGMENYWFVSTLAFPFGMFTASREEDFMEKIFQSKRALLFCVPMLILTVLGGNEGLLSLFLSSRKVIQMLSRTNLIMSSLLFTLCFGYFVQRMSKGENKILSFWGRHSYELYLIQGLFVRGFKEIVVLPNDLFYMICVIGCSLFSALLLKKMMDRVNLRKIMRGEV